jgi:hypothetical protein
VAKKRMGGLGRRVEVVVVVVFNYLGRYVQ